MGLMFLMLGPISFLFLAARYVSRHVKTGEMSYEYNETPSWSGLTSAVQKGKGFVGKALLLHAYWLQMQDRGGWEDTKFMAFWGFLVADYTGTCWIFAMVVLMKKIWMTTILGFFDGTINAVLCLAVQFFDTALVLYMWPHTGRMTAITESIGAITNLLAFTAISLPILVGPDIILPSFLGDLTNMVLASAATVMSAAVSLEQPISILFRYCAVGISFVAVRLGCFKGSMPLNALKTAQGHVVSNAFDESHAQLEAAYTQEDVSAGRSKEEPDEPDSAPEIRRLVPGSMSEATTDNVLADPADERAGRAHSMEEGFNPVPKDEFILPTFVTKAQHNTYQSMLPAISSIPFDHNVVGLARERATVAAELGYLQSEGDLSSFRHLCQNRRSQFPMTQGQFSMSMPSIGTTFSDSSVRAGILRNPGPAHSFSGRLERARTTTMSPLEADSNPLGDPLGERGEEVSL